MRRGARRAKVSTVSDQNWVKIKDGLTLRRSYAGKPPRSVKLIASTATAESVVTKSERMRWWWIQFGSGVKVNGEKEERHVC